jgi:hypothetical protein
LELAKEEEEISATCSMHEDITNAYKMLVRKPERNRPLDRPWHTFENKIKVDLTGCNVDWINTTQNRVQ